MSTAPALTAPSLLKIVRAHRLVETERLDAFVEKLPKETIEAPDPIRLAEALVGARLLTKFQAALLLQGKSRSLTIAGKYRLIDRLGAGGMGLVYLCEHLKMRRPVAVKVLPQKQATEPGQLDRFLREAQAAAAMKHPNIVQAHDIDHDNGVHYLVMEFVDGADLDRLVNTIGPLEPTRAAYYIAQAGAGLQHAAERGLVHRDIKPSNLLVDRDGVIKVLDLGLARLAGRGGLTERFDSNSVLGTADYISPEQALNSHDVDTRADIYSLGCTFYFLLAGRAPFKDANVTQKLLMHQVTEPTLIDEIRGDIPAGMPEVLEKMMAKDPAARYQSPAEVVEALAEWTDPPPPPPTDAELPPRTLGTSSPSDSSVSGRGQVTLTLPKGGVRTGVTGALTTRRPMRGASPAEVPPSAKKKWAIWGGVAALGIVVIGLAAWHPWTEPSNPDDWQDGLPKNRPVATPPPQARTTPARPARGFGYLLLDPGTARPPVVNGSIRETPTDVLYVNTSDLAKAMAGDTDFTPVFNRDAFGRGAARVVPYAVVQTASNYANTFVAVDASGPRSLVPVECVTADRIAGATSEHNAMLRGSVVFKPGLTELNSLITDLSDVGAGAGGSTIKLYSGAILFAGSPRDQNTMLGAGSDPLTLDFVGHTGYMTLASDLDFAVKGRATREHLVRARLTGFGESPLVLSGMWGTALGMDASENEAARLVVQGISLIGGSAPDKVFRVSFIDDRELGRPQGSVTLVDATLNYRGDSSVDIDRPLILVTNRTGRLSATERAKGPKVTLRWTGKISGGGRLAKAGNAPVFLNNGQNDYSGGTEVTAGVLSLAAEYGTPAGSGGIIVNNGATLTGTGKVPGGITVKPGGNLQPGTDVGKAIRLSGLSLQKGKIAGREGDVTATFTARPTADDCKLLLYEGTGALDLGSASLKVTPAGSFKPTDATRVYLILNPKAPAVRGTFQNLEGGARVVTTDSKWTARISYQGDAKSGVAAGGKDVMLYDWAPAGK